jgi:hypothetical protein
MAAKGLVLFVDQVEGGTKELFCVVVRSQIAFRLKSKEGREKSAEQCAVCC